MRHRNAFIMKFLLVAAILFFMLLIFENASWVDILIISLLITIVSYVIGDLFILPRTGVFTAAVADFVINFAAIYFLASLFIEQAYPLGIVSGFAAFFIACVEGFFHRYMIDHVFIGKKENQDSIFMNRNLQTEFAEEDVVKKSNKED